jgi:peptidyl-prolyl cis-trans isomerase A (cyclophilin A)
MRPAPRGDPSRGILVCMNLRIAVIPTLFLSLLAGSCSPHVDELRDEPYVYVTLETAAGDIVVELDQERAPTTSYNFISYARRGAYDGTTFHRVMPSFVIQGGGWTSELHERAKADAAAGKPDVPIKNEWQNGLKNVRGTIAMARETDPDSATREFFINLADNAKLDTAREVSGHAGYAVFGHVVAGMDVVDRIAAVPTRSVDVPGVTDGSMKNVPIEPVIIVRVRLDAQRN